MYDQFRDKAIAAGAEVHRLAGKEAAVAFIADFMQREDLADAPGGYGVWADSPILREVDITALREMPALKFEVNRSVAAQARFGISQVQWALADTGSLVQDQTAVEQRLVSALPEIHIALLPSGGILGGKVELFTRLDPHEARYLAFITGPSRTADIERVLTIGVHGPRRLVIVVVDEAGGEQG